MAPLTASNCLEPPHGTGDLKARALWPDAFEATGGGIAEVEAALKVYLDEGYARTTAAGQSDETRANESARQWARYRAFRQRYETAITTPSSIGTDEGWSSSMLLTQIEHIGEAATEALAASDALLLPPEGEVAAASSAYGVIRSLR
jgi:hypothetical protein